MESLDILIREDLNITQLKNLKKIFNEKINSRIIEIREIKKISGPKRSKKIVRPPLYISDSSDDE